MMKNKKALSPVIATVLLISIVVVLAVFVFAWMRTFVKEPVLLNGKNIELVCPEVAMSASYDGINLAVSNDGNVFIEELRVKTIGETRTSIEINSETEGWVGIAPGGAAKIELTFENSAIKIDSLLIIPVLQGKTENGKDKIYVCDDKYGIEARLI